MGGVLNAQYMHTLQHGIIQLKTNYLRKQRAGGRAGGDEGDRPAHPRGCHKGRVARKTTLKKSHFKKQLKLFK